MHNLVLKPGLFHFHCGELPKDKKWKIRMEWEFLWSMVETYLSSKGECPLAFFLEPKSMRIWSWNVQRLGGSQHLLEERIFRREFDVVVLCRKIDILLL